MFFKKGMVLSGCLSIFHVAFVEVIQLRVVRNLNILVFGENLVSLIYQSPRIFFLVFPYGLFNSLVIVLVVSNSLNIALLTV